MKEFLINNWIFDNKSLYNINVGDKILDSLEKLKSEKAILMGENSNGYYYLSNGFRFGFSSDIVDEIGIDFSQSKAKIFLNNNDDIINLSESKIHEVLNYLNDHFVKWTPIENKDPHIFIIKLLEKDLFFIFDIYEGTLDKIAKSNPERT